LVKTLTWKCVIVHFAMGWRSQFDISDDSSVEE
jgi:hypothetical protein